MHCHSKGLQLRGLRKASNCEDLLYWRARITRSLILASKIQPQFILSFVKVKLHRNQHISNTFSFSIPTNASIQFFTMIFLSNLLKEINVKYITKKEMGYISCFFLKISHLQVSPNLFQSLISDKPVSEYWNFIGVRR